MEQLKAKYGPGVATLLRVRGLNPEGLVERILQDAKARTDAKQRTADAHGEWRICEELIRLIGTIEPNSVRPGAGERSQLAVRVEEDFNGMPECLQEEIVRYAISGRDSEAELSGEACDAWCRQMDRTSAARRRLPAALVVDDDPIYCRFVSTVLKNLGWTLEVATNPSAALSLASSKAFDLVLMDYALPGATGAEVARTIRAGIGPSSGAYILGASVADVRRECLEAGMDEYFQKPIDMNTLKNRAQTVAAASAHWHASEGHSGAENKLRALEEYRNRLQRIVTLLEA